MAYKQSIYNVFYEKNNIQYLWNTYSGALIQLDESGQKYLKLYTGQNDGSTEFKMLSSNGFIVDDRIDELGRIIYYEKQEMYTMQSDSISVVIALGMGCNYNCEYCFQSSCDKSSYMDEITAAKVVEYICNKIRQNPSIKRLNIKWFGGEPLLYTKTLEIISKRIIKVTDESGIEYSAGVITNGYFLDRKMALKLRSYRVTKVQITIDGMPEEYCKSKGTQSESFYTVINNIKAASDILKITIRLNIPNNDSNMAIATTDYLLMELNLLSKIQIYFAYLRDYSKDEKKAREAYKIYAHNYCTWLDHIIKRYGNSMINGSIPVRKRTSCGYIRMRNICIGTRGEFYKCEHCFGDENSIVGDVWNDKYYNKMEFTYATTIEQRTSKRCLKCSFLPICMGGCANDYLNGLIGQDCDAFKDIQFKLKLLEGGIRV